MLVVEDEQLIGSSLQRALHASGYDADWLTDGQAALAQVRSGGADLVLLDLGLPDGDGVAVARAMLTARPELPIIMLTARTEECDVVTGLHAGAVDYVTKPFRLAELLARIAVHLRTATAAATVPRLLTVGDLRLDLAARRVWVGGAPVELRVKEFDLLAALAAAAGTVLTRERLLTQVWDELFHGSSKTLDVHVAARRRRLGEQPGAPSRISNVRGVGYRLETG